MRNTIVKLLALMLALVMVVSMVACGNDSDEVDAEGEQTTVDTSILEDGTKSAYKDSGLPERDYNGELFVIRYSTKTTSCKPDTFNPGAAEDLSTNLVTKASYSRDQVFQELTGTVIAYRALDYNPNGTGDDSDVNNIRILSGSGDLADVNMLCTGARAMGTLISENLLLDLSDYDSYIKPTQYWYASGVNAQMGVGGKLFAVAGYHTTVNYRYIQSIDVNNTILSDLFNDENKIDELYTLVNNKQWTMEKMFEYGKNYSTNDGETDPAKHNYVFIASENSIQGLFHGLGGTVVEKNANDIPEITIKNKENVDLLTYLRGKLLDDSSAVYVAPGDDAFKAFSSGKALFGQAAMTNFKDFAENNIDARLLPLPLNAEGDDYVSNMMPWTTNLVAIPMVSDDPDMSAYCIEAFMALAYDYIYPEFYETIFKLKYVDSDAEAQMFDIVTSASYIDLVETYQWQSDNTAVRKILVSKNEEVGSAVEKIHDEVNGYLQEFFKTYKFG